MNISHTSSPSRRTPLPALRLCLAAGIALLAIATSATAAVRYVSPTGGGSGTQASPWSLAQANASTGLQAGDTARLMTGTYTNQKIAPFNNGTSSSLPITYIKDSGTVTLVGSPSSTQPQVDFTNKSWIVVDGITLTDSNTTSVSVVSSAHCTVQNCTIARAKAWASIGVGASPRTNPSTYTTIRNCVFPDSNFNGTTGGPNGDHIYHSYSHHTLIDNCTFARAPHQTVNIQAGSSYVIVQNCTSRNTWHTDMEAYSMEPEDGSVPSEAVTNVVFQDNRVYDTNIDNGTNPRRLEGSAWREGHGFEMELKDGIFRRNIFHRSDPNGTNDLYVSNGLALMCWQRPTGGQNSTGNRLYNNVVAGYWRGLYMHGSANYVLQNNAWKNNIVYMSTLFDLNGDAPNILQSLIAYNNFYSPGVSSRYKGISGSIQTIQNASSDLQNNSWVAPQFTSVSFGSSPARDFTLLSGSPMIDAGDWLTTTTGAGTNLSVVPVNDARYFCDGFDLITGDMVVVGSNAAKLVTAVNYTSTPNTITLASPITWSTGAKVSLPYSGAKPDMGAVESTSASAPNAPSNLVASSPTSSSINLSWTDNSSNETGFEIDRATNSTFTTGPSPITNAYTTGANPTMPFTAGGLLSGTTYYFRVRATNAVGDSANYPLTGGISATTSAGTGPFQMVSNQVVMEAEHATTRTAGTPTAYNWTDVTESGASGAGSNNAIQSLPNTTDVSVATPSTVACRADYQITVPAGSAAAFYVHVRGRGADGADNSINVSIDGSTATYQTIGNLPTGSALGVWVVSGGTLAIPSGTHTVTVWMRENGAIIDKLVVKNNTTLPTGTGPAESPH